MVRQYDPGETHWFALIFRREPRSGEEKPQIWKARILRMPRSAFDQSEQVGQASSFQSLDEIPLVVHGFIEAAVKRLESLTGEADEEEGHRSVN